MINCFTCLERGKLLFRQGEIDLEGRNVKGENIPKSQQDRVTQNLPKRRKHIRDNREKGKKKIPKITGKLKTDLGLAECGERIIRLKGIF